MASSLRVDGKLIATDLSLASETVFAGWFGAHDPEYGAWSPGSIRTLRTVEAAFEMGVEWVDLARGDEGYKDTLKTGDTELATGYVSRFSGSALAYQAVHVPMAAARSYVLTHPAGPHVRSGTPWPGSATREGRSLAASRRRFGGAAAKISGA